MDCEESKMKKKLLISLIVLLSFVQIIPCSASYIEDRNMNEYYYWSSSDYIVIHNCSYGSNYSLTFGTNLKVSERIYYNWTAKYGSYKVYFKQSNDPLDSSDNRVAQLQISLYEDNVLVDTTYRTVMYYDDQWDMGLMINLIVILIPFLIIGSLIIGIVYYYFNIR